MSVFSGIWVPLVTPFTSQGAVDHAALDRLVRRLVADGVSGLVVLGTTGEPSSLDADEQQVVLDTVLDAAGNTPVIAGLAGNNAAQLLTGVAQLAARPLAGLLVPAPYYVRPSQDGIRQHFRDLADASAHPIVIYDIPYRTGVEITTDTLLDLAAHPNIAAIKDCGGSLDKTLALLRDGRLQVLAGEDLQMFSVRCLGGHGAIAASAHVRTREVVAMDRALADGRLAEGRALFHALVPGIRALFSEPNPAPVKAVLAKRGEIESVVRAPLTAASPAFIQRWSQLTRHQPDAHASGEGVGHQRTEPGGHVLEVAGSPAR